MMRSSEKRTLSHSASSQRDSVLRVGGKQLRIQSPFTTALSNESDTLSEVQTFPSESAASLVSGPVSTLSQSVFHDQSMTDMATMMRQLFSEHKAEVKHTIESTISL